ncbi:MAG: hypothetical protein UT03_C0035G0005 [Candidatus Moranbacteria bacterium GW2011_GWD2_38_7]|nr:MAG: hypothetical protein US82_C0017G0016 [Parcubacteria group bacterium GW2011_GWC1_38_22]KKQ80016.1 MAG: hypothetical protein UT03_C0035G0005 [Candidatus Moranbacteria bacterium GW2011_GWD2_38_7]
MKKITLVLIIVVTFIIGGGVGYFSGNSMKGDDAQDKKMRDSVTMMKDQESAIKKMGEMMQSSGAMMQEMGTKYSDNGALSKGKDLQLLGEKYLKDTTKKAESDDSMKGIMGN